MQKHLRIQDKKIDHVLSQFLRQLYSPHWSVWLWIILVWKLKMVTNYLSGWINEILAGKRRRGKCWIILKINQLISLRLHKLMKKKSSCFALTTEKYLLD